MCLCAVQKAEDMDEIWTTFKFFIILKRIDRLRGVNNRHRKAFRYVCLMI